MCVLDRRARAPLALLKRRSVIHSLGEEEAVLCAVQGFGIQLLRYRIALVVEGFGILEPPFPQGGPQERGAPARRVRRSHAAREGQILKPFTQDGLPEAGRDYRGRSRDPHASVCSRRASGFSSIRSLKEGHMNQVPPQGEPADFVYD